MASAKLGLALLVALVCTSPGCATTSRYPFRGKPRATAAAPPRDAGTGEDESINTLERDLNMYSD